MNQRTIARQITLIEIIGKGRFGEVRWRVGTLTEFHNILQLLIYAILKLLKFSNLLAYEFIKSNDLIISYERPVD